MVCAYGRAHRPVESFWVAGKNEQVGAGEELSDADVRALFLQVNRHAVGGVALKPLQRVTPCEPLVRAATPLRLLPLQHPDARSAVDLVLGLRV